MAGTLNFFFFYYIKKPNIETYEHFARNYVNEFIVSNYFAVQIVPTTLCR